MKILNPAVHRFSTQFFTFLFAFFCLFLNKNLAQNAQIQNLERELIPLSGGTRAHKIIEIAEANFQIGLYQKCAERADEAATLAKKVARPDLRAKALHWQGRGLAAAEKKTVFGKNRAAPKFLLSNEIIQEAKLNDPNLMISNFEALKSLAEKSGRTADVQKLETQIAAVKNGGSPTSISNSPDSKKELRDELSKLETEKAALNQKLQQQLAAQTTNIQKTEDLKKQSTVLMEQLAAKEAAISQMTAEQMKSEMILMQQNQLLDSLSFRASLDSVNLMNNELMLSETKSSRNFLLAAAAALFLLFGGSLYSFIKARQYNQIIKVEQKRSEDLLLNILPALVAKELKKQGYTNPQSHESVAVLFADFVGFSKIAEILSPEDLVKELDTAFKAFDGIIQKNGLEKIKTIGDCYMCASGLTAFTDNNHILKMVDAAKEMQDWLAKWNAELSRKGHPRFDARIGIHAGPVVAGVVGSKKFAFDIWGDTVNIAARVEQAGEGGKINISGVTYEQIKNEVACKYRGALEAKNKGKIDMYFVEG